MQVTQMFAAKPVEKHYTSGKQDALLKKCNESVGFFLLKINSLNPS
jgi:hypothetical protein